LPGVGHNSAVTSNGTATRATAVTVVIAASVLLTGCVSTVSGSAVRATNAGPVDAPPLNESKLDDVLLSVDEINGIMGATDMTVTDEYEEMTPDTAELSDPACVGALFGAMESVYDGSGWTAVVDQIASEEVDDNAHWVEQTAVLYPSADKAQKFFDGSRTIWEDCADSSISVDESGSTYLWTLDGVTAEDTLLTQMTTQEEADGWGCQHALSVVSNAIIEAWACSYTIGDEAAIIATDMVAKAAKK
jgi:PknH-like extracellular domain